MLQRLFWGIIALAVLLVGISFTVLNQQMVSIDYHFGHLHMHTSLLVATSFIAGALLSWLFCGFKVLQLKQKNRKIKRQLKRSTQD